MTESSNSSIVGLGCVAGVSIMLVVLIAGWILGFVT